MTPAKICSSVAHQVSPAALELLFLMAPYVNMDITVSHPPPVFHRYCITTGKIHPRRFLLLAHPNATWQRLDLLPGQERRRRRFTKPLIPAETKEEINLGGQQRCWNICKKTAELLCMMRF